MRRLIPSSLLVPALTTWNERKAPRGIGKVFGGDQNIRSSQAMLTRIKRCIDLERALTQRR